MTLTVEDGTGLAGAEAYRSVANHKTYCDARGISYAAYTDTQLEQQARKATDYLTQAYGQRWAGYRTTTTQALDFPRAYVPRLDLLSAYYYDSDAIPTILGDAQSELMIRVAADALAPDLERGIKREKVGPIETEYDTNSQQATRYPAVEMLLRPLLKAGGSVVGLVRG